MSELIKVETNESGKQAVSAKDLYEGLGLNKSQWSRWASMNIVTNDFFKENVDWVGVRQYVEGNETVDYAISIDFAKHIAMMARTQKSHQYRNYFIECENKMHKLPQMTQQEILIATLQEQQKIVARVDKIEVAVNNNIRIDCGQQRKLQRYINARVCIRCERYVVKGEKVLKEFKRKMFSEIYKEIKDRFAVSSYRDVKQQDFNDCLNYINNWIEKQY